MPAGQARTTVLVEDGCAQTIKTGAGEVYFVTATAGTTGGTFSIACVCGCTSTAMWTTEALVSQQLHSPFSPPMKFENSLVATVSGSNLTLVVGYN